MKKLISLGVLISLFVLAINAQNPKLNFDHTVHDFGTIQEDNGIVTTTFEFINDGNAPLVVSGVSASCGCTITDWTREPVPENGRGFVTVSYNPKGRPGQFTKSVRVRNNATEQPVSLQIKGEVMR